MKTGRRWLVGLLIAFIGVVGGLAVNSPLEYIDAVQVSGGPVGVFPFMIVMFMVFMYAVGDEPR